MRQSIPTTTARARATRDTHARRPRAGLRGLATLTAAAVLSVTAGGGIAVADDLWNTIDTTTVASIDATPEHLSLDPGAATTVKLRLQAKAFEFDGSAGCNVTSAKPATFEFTSSNPDAVTITSPESPAGLPPGKAHLTFTSCSTSMNNFLGRELAVQARAAGGSDITARVLSSATGEASFDVAPASFRVQVGAPAPVVTPPPPPPAPTVTVLGVVDGADYPKGSPPGASCLATHSDGRTMPFPALQVKTGTGPDGLGAWAAKCTYVEYAGAKAYVNSAAYNLVDTTPPVITYALSVNENARGWHREDVRLRWSVIDAQSPNWIESNGCGEVAIVTDDIHRITCTATSYDKTRSTTVTAVINRDATAPTVTGAIVSDPIVVDGVTWYADQAKVAWSSTDAVSGVESSWSTVGGQLDAATKTSVITTEGRNQLARVVSRDLAGNTGGYSVQFINIDGSAPVIGSSPIGSPNTDGWYKDKVDVAVQATDPEVTMYERGSGLAIDPTGTHTFRTSGPHTVVATDRVGHRTEHAVDVKVDAKDPVVKATCPTSPLLKDSTSATPATWEATDEESGLATPRTGALALDTSAVGARTATVAAGTATDGVGHLSAAATCGYDVHYDFKGFFSPVDNGGVYNQVKAGSAVPVKFSLGGNQGLLVLDGTPSAARVACPSTASMDAVEETVTTLTSSLKYDALANQYNYVWKTASNFAGTCQKLTVKLNDGTSKTALFRFVK